MLRQGGNPGYFTGCLRKGQTENELVGQYQTLDGGGNGRTVEDRQRWKIVVHDAINHEPRMTKNRTAHIWDFAFYNGRQNPTAKLEL